VFLTDQGAIAQQNKELRHLQPKSAWNVAGQPSHLVLKKIIPNQVRHLNELSVWKGWNVSNRNNNHKEWREWNVVFRNLQDQMVEEAKVAVDLAEARAAADPEGVKQSERVVNWPPFLIHSRN
jgi:hypothetical protein